MSTEPENQEPDHSWPWPLSILRKEWPIVKGAPVSFMLGVVVCGILLSLGAYWLVDRFYGAEIRAQTATIKTVESERDSYRKQLEDAGVFPSSLKKRVLILATQLDRFTTQWPTNDAGRHIKYDEFSQRFENRIEKAFRELDEHGQPSTQSVKVWNLSHILLNPSMSSSGGADEILQASRELKRLAEQLKD
jgi:hypothetical protein